MRLLHTADWHIGRTIEGRDRTREHEEFFDELYHIAEDEKDKILKALHKSNGNKTRAAKLLNIDRKTLYNKIHLYNIEL